MRRPDQASKNLPFWGLRFFNGPQIENKRKQNERQILKFCHRVKTAVEHEIDTILIIVCSLEMDSKVFESDLVGMEIRRTLLRLATILRRELRSLGLVWFYGISTMVVYLMLNSFYAYEQYPWCNGYRRRKWTRRHEFKSWTRLIAFHIALILLGKVWIQLFSLQLWINSRADLDEATSLGEGKLWILTSQTPCHILPEQRVW